MTHFFPVGIYEPPFLILLQWTNLGCENCLLSGVCSLQVEQGTVYSLVFPSCNSVLYVVHAKVNAYVILKVAEEV
jgi:hypothetical protein